MCSYMVGDSALTQIVALINKSDSNQINVKIICWSVILLFKFLVTTRVETLVPFFKCLSLMKVGNKNRWFHCFKEIINQFDRKTLIYTFLIKSSYSPQLSFIVKSIHGSKIALFKEDNSRPTTLSTLFVRNIHTVLFIIIT
jgi:hypothetical protein